jgi:hypothetical protein
MVTSLVVALFFDVFLPKLVFILAVDGATVLLPNAPSIFFVFVTACFVVKPANGVILAEIVVGVVVANVIAVEFVVGDTRSIGQQNSSTINCQNENKLREKDIEKQSNYQASNHYFADF